MSLFRFFVDKTEQKLLRIRRGASEETPNGSGNPAIVTITRTRYLRFIETGRAVTTIADQPSDVVKSWRIPSTDYASVSFYKESGSNPETPWRYSWIWSNKEDIVRSFFKYHPEICSNFYYFHAINVLQFVHSSFVRPDRCTTTSRKSSRLSRTSRGPNSV